MSALRHAALVRKALTERSGSMHPPAPAVESVGLAVRRVLV
jgi:hypothetical protein